MDLTGKVALVTGASRGIGRATALALAEAGAHIAITARNEKLLQSLAGEVRMTGREVFIYSGDLREEKSICDLIQKTVFHFGTLHILVNNAGLGYFDMVSDMPTAHWDEMFGLNVRAAFIATRESLPHLRKAGESAIVNVVSVAGKNAFIGGGGYAASKHALLGFSRCVMLEERKNGVRVVAVCPGSVVTDFNHPDPELKKKAERMLQPEDVADAIKHALMAPQRAMISELDIRPTNPS